MTVKLTRLLTVEEYNALNDDAMVRGFWRDDPRIFQPGWGWPCPWWLEDEHRTTFLSQFYMTEWFGKRPPLCVVLPNGQQWEIDRKSSNGQGWQVTGTWPLLTASPSIAASGYHGFLQQGAFTPDCERPATPDGVYPYPRTWRSMTVDPQRPRYVMVETISGDPPPGYREPKEPEEGWIYS